jgi:hypothetical protein
MYLLFGQYAHCQNSDTERDDSFRTALAVANRCFEVTSRDSPSSYDAFEIAMLGLWVHNHCKAQSNFPTELQERIKMAGRGNENEGIDTEFPTIREQYLKGQYKLLPGQIVRSALPYYRVLSGNLDIANMKWRSSALQLGPFE